MNGRKEAIAQIKEFLLSDETGLLLTGTNQYEKHKLVMKLLNRTYRNKHILFRINSMQNIDDDNFTPLTKRPKSGETVRLGNNYYTFDALTSSGTWRNTIGKYDFAIVYPIDWICREKKLEPIGELFRYRNIGKTFLCSWTDWPEYDYKLLEQYYSRHIVYDAEDEDPEYHKRMLEIVGEE